MFQYSFSKSKSYFCILLIVSYFRRKVSVPARGTKRLCILLIISNLQSLCFLHPPDLVTFGHLEYHAPAFSEQYNHLKSFQCRECESSLSMMHLRSHHTGS